MNTLLEPASEKLKKECLRLVFLYLLSTYNTYLHLFQRVETTIEDTRIEIEVTQPSTYGSTVASLKINGQPKQITSRQQIVVKQQDKVLAIVECENQQCEIKSSKHGLYVRVNLERVKVEVSL